MPLHVPRTAEATPASGLVSVVLPMRFSHTAKTIEGLLHSGFCTVRLRA